MEKKPVAMSEQQALLRLTTLCMRGEHCQQEMVDKMKRWQLPDEAIARNMQFLVEKKFVDDSRFVRAFIRDKLTYNKWGRRKIEQALWQKRIPRTLSDPVFAEIEGTQYEETLLPLLRAKWPSVKARSDYERSQKLIRFALGRGYDYDVVRRCMEQLGQFCDEADD